MPWKRALVAYNYPLKMFVDHVVRELGGEFDVPTTTQADRSGFVIEFGEYVVFADRDACIRAQTGGPYGLDRYLLDRLLEQGMLFDIARSRYIRTCFGGRPPVPARRRRR